MFKRFNKLAAVAALAVAAGLGSVHTASAGVAPATLSLDTFLDGGINAGGFTFGDKRYSNFNFSSTGDVVLGASDVDMVFAEEGNKQFLAFMLNVDVGAAQHADIVVGYDVTVLDPTRNIRSVGLTFEGGPNGTPTGRASASVTETVTRLDGGDLVPGGPVRDTELFTGFNDGDGFLADNTEATLAINPAMALRFTKDVIISARANTEGAGVSVLENSVTQNPTAVPLPAAFWAAAPVLGGIVARRKLRRSGK
jgi:hypothetical protein